MPQTSTPHTLHSEAISGREEGWGWSQKYLFSNIAVPRIPAHTQDGIGPQGLRQARERKEERINKEEGTLT